VKVKNTELPEARVAIDVNGDMATLSLWDGESTETTREDGAVGYEYDLYQCRVRDRPNLIESVKANFEIWYDRARRDERDVLASEIRQKRNEMLAETDYLVAQDYPLPPELAPAVWAYRQALRDIPEQPGFPYNVKWPAL
jgi:hypothetical protein